MILLSVLMLAQAQAVSEPKAVEVAQKPKKVCQMIEVTGSRSKRRVCRDASGNLDLGPGVSNSGFGKARINQSGAASTSPSMGQ